MSGSCLRLENVATSGKLDVALGDEGLAGRVFNLRQCRRPRFDPSEQGRILLADRSAAYEKAEAYC